MIPFLNSTTQPQKRPVIVVFGFCRSALFFAALAYLLLLASVIADLLLPTTHWKEYLAAPAYLILVVILFHKVWKIACRLGKRE